MKASKVPETIRTIIGQAGGMGLQGPFTYIGAHDFGYKCAEPEGEYRSGYMSKLVSKGGLGNVDFEVGLRFKVNGKPGKNWVMIIAYEPDDTYSVWLIEGHPERKPGSMVLACHRDVYCDMLRQVIEQTYDQAIRDHNQGFIPL